MTSPEVRRRYDALAKSYDEGYVGPKWTVHDHVTWATVAPLLPAPGADVLDLGAGTGKWSVRFLRRGDRVTLLEPSAEMLEAARARVREEAPGASARFVAGGLPETGLPAGAFDVVFCEGDPLSYVGDLAQAAAREILRVLRPGGVFYVSCDGKWLNALTLLMNGHDAPFWECVERGASFDPYGIPVRAFDPAELVGIFEAAGARDVRVSGKVHLAHFLPDERLAALLADPASGPRLLALEADLAANPSVSGLAGHLQVVGRRL